jgi:diguanylate cyclase (GGDEF)-like protein/PAS domain S-box-containing protein
MLHRIIDRLVDFWSRYRFDDVDKRVRRLGDALYAEQSPHDDPAYQERFLNELFTSTGHGRWGSEYRGGGDGTARSRFADAAVQWKRTLALHSSPTHHQGALDDRLAGLLAELSRHVSASPGATMSASEIGHEIAYNFKSTPSSYRYMIELLVEFLRTGTTPDPTMTAPAWVRVLAEFGEGYAAGTRERALDEQNEILSVVATMRTGQQREPLTNADQFREMFTKSPVAMALLDDTGRILEANAALHALLDQPADALHHANLVSFARTAQDRAMIESLHRCLIAGQTRGCLPEFRITSKDPEEPVWVRLHWAQPDPGARQVHVVIEDITEDYVVRQWLHHLANYDSVTGLPNRRYLLNQLEKRFADDASATTIGLYAIRLDGLPAITTTLGPIAGELVLNALVARAQHAAATTADLIAQLDPATLVVMITDRESWAKADDMVRRLVDWLAEPVPIDHSAVSITPTVGVAEGVVGSTTAETLVHRLERALHAISSDTTRRWTVIEDRHSDQHEQRNQHLARLPAAFDADEIVLTHAPIARARTGEVVGSHASPEWVQPDLWPTSAVELIDLATTIGLSIPIVPWLANRAAAQAALWQETLGPHAPFIRIDLPEHLAVNENIVDTVRSALRDYRVRPDRFQLGLHESNILDRHGRPRTELVGLSGGGVRLVLNGLGTDVRELSLLTDLCLHGVAIAPQFTAELHTVPRQGRNSIPQAMIELGQTLGLVVSLQGVDATHHVHLAKKFGDVDIEGTGIGKPGPAEGVEQRIRGGIQRPVRHANQGTGSQHR